MTSMRMNYLQIFNLPEDFCIQIFPLLSKMNNIAVNQDSEEPSVKNWANESLTWMRLSDCPWDGSRGTRTVLHDFSIMAAFASIIAFESEYVTG